MMLPGRPPEGAANLTVAELEHRRADFDLRAAAGFHPRTRACRESLASTRLVRWHAAGASSLAPRGRDGRVEHDSRAQTWRKPNGALARREPRSARRCQPSTR